MTRRSDVIFRADGRFDLTARVVRALDIFPGDVVDVLSNCIAAALELMNKYLTETDTLNQSRKNFHAGDS